MRGFGVCIKDKKMNRALKLSLIGAGVVGGGLLIYALLRRLQRNRQMRNQEVTPSVNPSTSNNTPSSIWGDDSFPLGYRSYGPKVVAVQLYLNERSNANLVVDGKFGSGTATAWKNEQYPFSDFRVMYPNAVEGEMSEQYYNQFVKEFESRNAYKNAIKDLGMA